MTSTARSRAPRRPEREIVEVVARHLVQQGYRVRMDPDGTDYFDIVARKGNEVGLVEVKVGDAKAVLAQALKRRGWGDWSAVALGSGRAAERLMARTQTTRAAPIGVWSIAGKTVRVHRPAKAWVLPGAEDPFGPLRERFRRWLDLVDTNILPSTVRWEGLPGAVRRASGGRGFAEWRLDEPAGEDR
jgi:hypothetical protein